MKDYQKVSVKFHPLPVRHGQQSSPCLTGKGWAASLAKQKREFIKLLALRWPRQLMKLFVGTLFKKKSPKLGLSFYNDYVLHNRTDFQRKLMLNSDPWRLSWVRSRAQTCALLACFAG